MWCRTASGLTHLDATASGGVTYPVNSYAAYPSAIAAGPVGSIWFGRYFSGTFATSPDDGEVGYLDAASGAVVAFVTGSRTAPNDLVRGPDGAMWFTSIGAAKGIGHIGADGRGGALTAIGGYAPQSLTFGADGLLYAADAANNVILRVPTTDLQVTNVDPGEGSVLLGSGSAAAQQVGKLKVGKRPIGVERNAVPVRIKCPHDAAEKCQGKVKLVAKGTKAKALSKSAKYKAKPGKKDQLQIRLNRKGLKAIAKKKAVKLHIELYLKGIDAPIKVETITIRR